MENLSYSKFDELYNIFKTRITNGKKDDVLEESNSLEKFDKSDVLNKLNERNSVLIPKLMGWILHQFKLIKNDVSHNRDLQKFEINGDPKDEYTRIILKFDHWKTPEHRVEIDIILSLLNNTETGNIKFKTTFSTIYFWRDRYGEEHDVEVGYYSDEFDDVLSPFKKDNGCTNYDILFKPWTEGYDNRRTNPSNDSVDCGYYLSELDELIGAIKNADGMDQPFLSTFGEYLM